jgi:hypothetical protein
MRAAVVLLLLLLQAAPVLAAIPDTPPPIPISLAEYRSRLEGIAGALSGGNPGAARAEAGRLLGTRISCQGQAGEGAATFSPDRSVLGPLARGVQGVELRRAAVRLATLLASLPEAGGAIGTTAGRADPALLARLAARAALADLPRGGKLPEIRDSGVLRAFADFMEPLRRWLDEQLDRLWRWLKEAFTRPTREGSSELDLPRLVTLLVIVLAAVLAGLGLLALRRRGAPSAVSPPPAAGPRPPARDDDPLSRRAGEWESYARELAAAGRFREAIRAWYHAVLVALYQRGALHHRKGRTNWEYVASVPPEAAWRPAFVAVTRRFEREWYGGDRSSREALEEAAAEARELLDALRSPVIPDSRDGEAA